ncbi:hypothetical protein AB7080_12960 [Providencia rettgeri]|uniref:hypothetical protein n=1 Tax=Providencia rettgeri TaxID=587 RepID=UPI001B3590DA|nr:hypothetical protein [Providencia rettgeri]EHZ7765168.1 hypothetical protein [Providencia rettgeri]EIJ7168310.1 hypothetical protein [Providencia rettgeri]EJD6048494.1 hypothetical protein [Providencia rettgeri]ELR5092123.1 hypothetical protein [Providencia rettgeri]ELR5106173.1 hypothetical protein [Providencia rettgeri]
MKKSAHVRQLINVLHLIENIKTEENTLYRGAIESLVSTFYLVLRLKLTEAKITQKPMRKSMTKLLTALREAREDLVSRSKNEHPQLFSCLFQYEKNENLLSLSFEREYSIFINNNLEKISNNITDFENINTQNKLKYIVKEFVGFKHSRGASNSYVFFLDDKANQIENILSVFERDKDRIEEINYLRRKEQVLFDRLFNKLLGGQNGLVK